MKLSYPLRLISIAILSLNVFACHAGTDTSIRATPITDTTTDAEQILVMAKKLYAIPRNESGFCAKSTESYFSQSMWKLIEPKCKDIRRVPDDSMLDNNSPVACEDEPKRSQGIPCYTDYKFSKPKIDGGKATMRVEYGIDYSEFYTVLKLIKEPAGWRVDDIAIISRAPDYEDGRPSIKAEMEKLMREHSAKK